MIADNLGNADNQKYSLEICNYKFILSYCTVVVLHQNVNSFAILCQIQHSMALCKGYFAYEFMRLNAFSTRLH